MEGVGRLSSGDFISLNVSISDTNTRLKVGLALFGISGLFLVLSAFFLIESTRASILVIGVPSDSFLLAEHAAIVSARLYVTIGGIISAIGAWFVITGHRQQTPSISA